VESLPALRPPQQRRSRASFERVLEAGARLLEEDGYEAFTLAEVSQRAGVSIGAIYARIDAKETLVLATLTSNSTHELAYVPEFAPARGRVNHIAFWCDQRVDVHRAADVLLSAGTPIEFGPGIHGVDEITYLYVREPGGVRIELNSGGRRIFQPDRETRRWHPQLGSNSMYRNIQLVESMLESFPAIDEQVAEMRATNQ
jgi:AcrR family transcriptional regulator